MQELDSGQGLCTLVDDACWIYFLCPDSSLEGGLAAPPENELGHLLLICPPFCCHSPLPTLPPFWYQKEKRRNPSQPINYTLSGLSWMLSSWACFFSSWLCALLGRSHTAGLLAALLGTCRYDVLKVAMSTLVGTHRRRWQNEVLGTWWKQGRWYINRKCIGAAFESPTESRIHSSGKRKQ